MTPSDKVMATGTIVEPIAPAVAEKIAAEDFSLVASNYRTQIYRFLLSSTRDVDLAETLTQECFLKAHRNWAGFRGDSTALTWLMRIAINVLKDNWRNRRMQFWRQTRSNAGGADGGRDVPPGGRG